MSIATEIQRLQQAKTDIKTAIEAKGVTVGDGTIDTYAEKISEISGGGGPSGYWERWVEAGIQIGPDEFDWPTEKNILKHMRYVDYSSVRGYMPDGTAVYYVTNGSGPTETSTSAYKETYEG